MTPKKYVSNFTSSTNNRGVEAKEIEVANTQLYAINATNSTGAPYQVESNSGSLDDQLQRGLAMEGSQLTSLPATEDASYIQVIVQKHHRKLERSAPAAGAAGDTPRRPQASSPIAGAGAAAKCKQPRGASGDARRELVVLPRPVLLAYRAPRARRPRHPWARLARAPRAPPAPPRQAPAPTPLTEIRKESFWKRMFKISEDELNLIEDGPERVEVYYFEQEAEAEGWARLRTTDGAPAAAAERWARRGARAGARACAELLAAPQALLALPVALALLVLRAACQALRGAALGALGVLADYLLKPALAALFNSLLRPPLVLLHNAARALRHALAPLFALLGDALEPPARLLAAARLVQL